MSASVKDLTVSPLQAFLYVLLVSYPFLSLHVNKWNEEYSHVRWNASRNASELVWSHTADLTVVLTHLPSLIPLVVCGMMTSMTKVTCRVPLLGNLLSSIVYLFGSEKGFNVQLVQYFSTVIYSLGGGVLMLLLGSFVYIASISDKKDANVRIGRMLGCLLFAQALGNRLSASITDGLKTYITVAIVISLAILVLSVVWLRGSQFVKASFRVMHRKVKEVKDVSVNRKYMVLVAVNIAVFYGCHVAELVVVRIFAADNVSIGWSTEAVDLYHAGDLLCRATGLLLLLPFLSDGLNISEVHLVMISLGLKVVSLALTSFAVESWMMYIALPFNVVDSIALSSLFTALGNLCNMHDISRVFSLTFCGCVFSASVLPILMTLLHNSLHRMFLGSAFVTLAVISLAMFMSILWLSNELQNYNHRLLLKGLESESENEDYQTDDLDDVTGNLSVDAEQWLLDAYDTKDVGLDMNPSKPYI